MANFSVFPTQDQLTDMLTNLLKSPPAVHDLMTIQGVPHRQYTNVIVGFPTFHEWYRRRLNVSVPGDRTTWDIPRMLRGDVQEFRDARSFYWDEGTDYLDQIITRRTGRELFDEIVQSNGDRMVVLLPWDKPGVLNAETSAMNGDWVDATEAGMPQLDDDGYPIYGAPVGTGTGSSAVIKISPGMWYGQGGPGHLPDEVLFHELVHASRILRGVHYRHEVDTGYNNLEEYIAVVVSNIYLSEKGQHYLRANHASHDDPSEDELADPDHFLDNAQQIDMTPRSMLQKFKLRQARFYGALARIPRDTAWFNPPRAVENSRFLRPKRVNPLTGASA